jgi:hypothetical protein
MKNYKIKVANKSSENVMKFGYLEMTPSGKNCMHEEGTHRLTLQNASYLSRQSLLSSSCCVTT